MSRSALQTFYNNQHVLITGGQSFLGKVLLEKLLRKTNVTIFLLLEDDPQSLFDDVIFKNLSDDVPNFRARVIWILGNCALNKLGVGSRDRLRLAENVNIVFHLASTNTDDFKKSYLMNVQATSQLLEFIKDCINLKVFLILSTAFASIYLKQVEEIVYIPSFDFKHFGKIVHEISQKQIKEYGAMFNKNWGDTFGCTKCMAENLVLDYASQFPVGIFRAAHVFSTTDGIVNVDSELTQLIESGRKGVVNVLNWDQNVCCNIVPADNCAYALIASAWDVIYRNIQNKRAIVYNYTPSFENRITWNVFFEKLQFPVLLIKNGFISWLLDLFLNYFFAIFYEFLCFPNCLPGMLSLYKSVHKATKKLKSLKMKNWLFFNRNVDELWNKLGVEDKELFPFNITELSWSDYLAKIFSFEVIENKT